jgi:hypothetical protein
MLTTIGTTGCGYTINQIYHIDMLATPRMIAAEKGMGRSESINPLLSRGYAPEGEMAVPGAQGVGCRQEERSYRALFDVPFERALSTALRSAFPASVAASGESMFTFCCSTTFGRTSSAFFAAVVVRF